MSHLNPCWPAYTREQTKRIVTGRAALLARWSGDTYTPHPMRVLHSGEELDESNVPVDVFTIRNAPPTLSVAWVRDAGPFIIESGPASFTVRVPHAHYLAVRQWCLGVDRVCALNTLVYVATIAALLYMAALIAAAPQ